MPSEKLKGLEGHFAFGKNWASYAALIGEPQIDEAKSGLLKLISSDEFAGHSFLDIGCGSGLHALAADRLGVSRILAVDIDPDSVETCASLLRGRGLAAPWRTRAVSVFDLDPETEGRFDIVYSWGVLHHTGSMWEAIGKAAAMVAPGGHLAIALYRPTHLDVVWKLEKRLYAHAPTWMQSFVRGAYVTAFRFALFAKGKRFRDYVANYKSARGMDYYHDVHDWLGGYPYEAAAPADVDRYLGGLGFTQQRAFTRPIGSGLFGSGCDEYVYRLKS